MKVYALIATARYRSLMKESNWPTDVANLEMAG